MIAGEETSKFPQWSNTAVENASALSYRRGATSLLSDSEKYSSPTPSDIVEGHQRRLGGETKLLYVRAKSADITIGKKISIQREF